MIISIGAIGNTKFVLKIGTHNGIKHCDDTVGISTIEIAYMETDIHLMRTENPDELKKLDIVIDIGGGKFDHHNAGFNLCRTTGEKYASAGLVWKEFGEKAIVNVAKEIGIFIDDEKIQKIKYQIDKEFIIPIDLEDNGVETKKHTFSFISQLTPTWLEKQDFDASFIRAEAIARDTLKEIIKNKIMQLETKVKVPQKYVLEILSATIKNKVAQVLAKPYLQRKCKNVNTGILEIPAQTMPWLKWIVNFNQKHSNNIKFVIFPYPRGGWAAQSIPPSIEKQFAQLIPFPKEWAGGNKETLPEISGIQDAILCHNGRFFARAETKESIIEMCNIAINQM